MIKLWRNTIVKCPGNGSFPLRNIFPSGRLAISRVIAEAGLGRADRIAIPEWSSQCVINAVGRFATPIPMKETVENNILVSGVLLYEQWGWPFADEAWEKARRRFTRSVIIHDRVDSADYFSRATDDERTYEIISFSKLLGLPGGGLARSQGRYLEPETELTVEPKALAWFKTNDLHQAVDWEKSDRRANLRTILDSQLSVDWPKWMKKVVDAGAAPGIAPLFRGAADGVLQDKKGWLSLQFGIEAVVYHFNWSGDPLAPRYEKCLAFPIHGEVTNINDILDTIGT